MKFKIQFGSNIFRKGEIIKSNTNDIVKVLKVYDFIWWRKILIKFKLIKPIYTIKVTTKW